MRRMTRIGLAVAVGGLSGAASGQMKDVPHPFILWTKDEAAAICKRLDNDPVAKQQLARTVEMSGGRAGHATLLNLFKYMVLGDAKAGEAEKRQVLGFQNRVPEPETAAFKEASKGRKWTRGGPSFSDRHMRDEQTLNTLRYDVLYDELTARQRAGIESSFRAYIDFHVGGHRPWHPDFHYDRTSWLPNMHWPRAIGTHLMAVALKDPKLIDAMFHSVGGWKWYFDEYISDGRFYNEEFGKYYSNIGTMLMYCQALHRLGLDRYGCGYVGKPAAGSGKVGGATMKRFMEMFFDLGYPRTEMPGGMPIYSIVHMGDTPGSVHGINGLGGDVITAGCLPGGRNTDAWFGESRMNGPLPKLRLPMWYEIDHRRWPDAGFDYFLAQLRPPGEDVYLPSLYWGLGPIEAKKVAPPPAPSYVAMERGFAMLRADESPAYWEGPAPAVAMQFGNYYVHYAHDCFSILGYQAFNRPIYTHGWGGGGGNVVNASIKAHPRGYCGGDPWHDTVRSYCGVVVDNLKAMPIESGNEGLRNHRIRQDLSPLCKFVAGRVKPTEVADSRWVFNEAKDEMETVVEKVFRGIYGGVDLERALCLTKEYLLDVYWLANTDRNGRALSQPRRYDWAVHGAGSCKLTRSAGWQQTTELDGSMLYRDANAVQPPEAKGKPVGSDLRDVWKLTPGEAAWSLHILQDCPSGDVAKGGLDKAWFDRKVGVRVSMLGEAGTEVFAARPPGAEAARLGGATVMVRRTTPATAFVALHEPFEHGDWKIDTFERIAQTPTAVAVRVAGRASPISGVAPDDRVCVAWGDGAGKEITLAGGGESFTFADYAFVRVGADKVAAAGNLKALQVKVAGTPKLIVSGKEAKAAVAGGVLTWRAE